ncbi:pilus assembly protein PilM [Halanaerocella petrolearia]
MGLVATIKHKLGNIFNKKVIGADIGEELVKLVEVETNLGNIVLNNLAVLETPKEAVKDGKLKKLAALKQVLEIKLSENNFKAKNVVTAISGEEVISRMVEIPKMPQEELTEAIKWEAEEKLPINIQEVVLDYEILTENLEGEYQVLIIAVRHDLIDKYIELFEGLNLNLVAIEIEPIAIARTINQLYNNSLLGILDIGMKTTDISIIKEGRLLFTRTIDLGGVDITEDIAENKELTFEQAEEYKQQTNLFVENNTNLIIRNLTTAIYRSLDYFEVKYNNKDLEQIIITGGGAKLAGFTDYLATEFGLKVEKMKLEGRLMTNITDISNRQLKETAQYLGVSIGLALREEEESD